MILVEHLSIQLGEFQLEDVSFSVPTGCYGVLMGKTGSGKSTILEVLCGLKSIQSNGQPGRICLMDRDVTSLKPAQRGIGYVPQDGALFSTMTIYNHLAFALRIRKWSAKQIDERVHELAAVLSIEHLLNRKPFGLSGGEEQRVALGRALAFHPSILLLDEPLSALDEETRYDMYALIRSIRQHYPLTALHVTHSWHEAKSLADRIYFLKDGTIQETIPSKDSHSAKGISRELDENGAEEPLNSLFQPERDAP